jgi:hypothetical protein
MKVMKKTTKKSSEEISMNAPNHMAILAILTEMVRHLNENISKVELKPLHEAFTRPATVDTAAKA